MKKGIDYSAVRGYRIKYITSQIIHADGTTEKGNNVVGYTVQGPFKYVPEPLPALIITTTSLPSGISNNAYSYTVTAIGGDGLFAWSADGLPSGLTINATTGIISGIPTKFGSFTDVSITVTSAGLSHTKIFEFTIGLVYSVTLKNGNTATIPATGRYRVYLLFASDHNFSPDVSSGAYITLEAETIIRLSVSVTGGSPYSIKNLSLYNNKTNKLITVYQAGCHVNSNPAPIIANSYVTLTWEPE